MYILIIRIEDNGGTAIGGRVQGTLGVSRAFGDISFKEKNYVICNPDIFSFSISNTNHFIVLACDGLWDVMSNQDVINFVFERLAQNEDQEKIVEELVCEAYDKGSNDNITAMIIVFPKKFLKSLKKVFMVFNVTP